MIKISFLTNSDNVFTVSIVPQMASEIKSEIKKSKESMKKVRPEDVPFLNIT